MKLSTRLEQYRLILKQLGTANDALYDLGFIGERDHNRTEAFVVDEKVRVDRALKAFGLYADAQTPAPTGIPSLDAARKVASASAAAGGRR